MTNELDTPLILALDDASATLELVGGKGASLARMAATGLPVPPGFHVTTAAYRRFVAENGLQEGILTAVTEIAIDMPTTLDEASRQIARLFAQSDMPADIAEAISQAYADLGTDDQPVAVRSSATAEDLPEMSFAGQQETYLNMRGRSIVLDAVKRCWTSLWTARAIGYRARHKIAQDDVSLAVVVQQLVPADAAGILFTANPLTGARDQAMINAAWGLGEAIVGGQVTPDTVVVDKATGKIIEQQINEKTVMTVRTPEGTHEEPVPAEKRTQAVLTTTQAAELARIGTQIEQLYGQPMDIEWALHDGQTFIVQARPITALPDFQQHADAQGTQADVWKLPTPKGRYVRSSVLELLPDPLSPLFATLGLPAFSRATTALIVEELNIPYPAEPLVVINGYGYYDVSFTPSQTLSLVLIMPRMLSSLLPQLLRTSQGRWQEAHSRYEKIVKHWETTDITTSPAEYLLNGVREITAEAVQYYLTIQSGILPAAYISEMLFTQAYNRLLKHRNDPPALTFLLGYDSAPIQAEKSLYDLAQWVREQPELTSKLTDMSSEQFTTAYHEQDTQTTALDGAWSTFWHRLAEHLARFGHTIYDLDFAKAVLADDPSPILETLKFFLTGQAPDPHKRQATAEEKREQATQRLLKQSHGLRLRLFRRLVGSAQRYAPLREDALADVGLGWPVLRKMLREIGQRLVTIDVIDTPDDVFWLTLDELQEATTLLDEEQTPTKYHTIIAERRATWKSRHRLTPPVALPPKVGATILGIDFSRLMPAHTEQQSGKEIKGIGASPGKITGVARVIHGPEEFGQLKPGDILVAKITTPAWTPLFALASGVITDVGGPLSHSSIVAREYHIPAVLGTGVATERLKSGEQVTVDGDTGTVTLSSYSSSSNSAHTGR